MHAPLSTITPRVQRKCDCEGGAATCDCKKKMQKKSRGSQHDDAYEREADRFAEQNAPHLDVRHPQLAGHDFSKVRIHDDAHAHAKAEAENARAFTYGSDIYFARGELARPDARQLLAHELAHTVQQGAATTVRRKEPVDADGCTQPQRLKVDLASLRAYDWVQKAIGKVRAYIGAPAANASVATALTISRFSTDPDYANALQARLEMIRQGLRSEGGLATIHCAAPNDPGCRSAGGYTGGQEIFICQDQLDPESPNLDRLAVLLVHEASHAFAKNLGGKHQPIDIAYSHKRLFRVMSPEEAFDNAESYQIFIQEVNSQDTSKELTAPSDDIRCGENSGKVILGMAYAEQLQTRLMHWLGAMNSPEFDSNHASAFPQGRRSLGVVRDGFRHVNRAFAGEQKIVCVDKKDPRCGAGRYALEGAPPAPLQVCPAYSDLPYEEWPFRMYRMLFHYVGAVPSSDEQPYFDLVQNTQDKLLPGLSARLPMLERSPKVQEEDKARYRSLVVLAGKATMALTPSDPDNVADLLHELESKLLAPDTMTIRFNDQLREPSFDPFTNRLTVPTDIADGDLIFGLLREMVRMRYTSRKISEPERTKGGGTFPIAEMLPMHFGIIDVLVRAGLFPDKAAAGQAGGNVVRGEKAAHEAAPARTIFPIFIAADGRTHLETSSGDSVILGVLPTISRTRADYEHWLRIILWKRASNVLFGAFAAGDDAAIFRVYQDGDRIFDFEVKR